MHSVPSLDSIAAQVRRRAEYADPAFPPTGETTWVEPQHPGAAQTPSFEGVSVERADAFVARIRSGDIRIGTLPPTPPTFRGRLGRGLVHLVHRALFWLLPQLHQAEQSHAEVVSEQSEALRSIVTELRTMSARIDMVGEESKTVRRDFARELLSAEASLKQAHTSLQSSLTEHYAAVKELRRSHDAFELKAADTYYALSNRLRVVEHQALAIEDQLEDKRDSGLAELRTKLDECLERIDARQNEIAKVSHDVEFARANVDECLAGVAAQQEQLGVVRSRLDQTQQLVASQASTSAESLARMTEHQQQFEQLYGALDRVDQNSERTRSEVMAIAAQLELMRRSLDLPSDVQAISPTEFLARVGEQQNQIDQLRDALQSVAQNTEYIRAELAAERQLLQTRQERSEYENRNLRADLVQHGAHLTLLSHEIQGIELNGKGLGKTVISDEAYVRFESVFRGGRSDIKQRQSTYLGFIEASIGGSPDSPVLDLGCGRGEWLELLSERGIYVSGVDKNRVMVDECTSRGLNARVCSALDYLMTLPSATVGAVTCFHMAEHLEFPELLELVRHCYRVIKPGGIVIFETPNPENLNVGACTFWLDPTHKKPIPPALFHFILELAGFNEVEVIALHPYPEPERLSPEIGRVADLLNRQLLGERDYGVIGRRPN